MFTQIIAATIVGIVPGTITVGETSRLVYVVEYSADSFQGSDADEIEGNKFLAFWTDADMHDMMLLFYPGDRDFHTSAAGAIAEAERYITG